MLLSPRLLASLALAGLITAPSWADETYRTYPIPASEIPAIAPMSARFPVSLDIYKFPVRSTDAPATGTALNFGEVNVAVDGRLLNTTIPEWVDGSRPKPALLRVPYRCPDTSAADCDQTSHNRGWIDKTMAEMRGVMEAMGMSVTYEQTINGVEVRKITATKENLRLEAWVGSRTALVYINNRLMRIINQDIGPFVTLQGRTMVTLSLVADALAAKIDWDGTSKTAAISSRTNYYYDYADHNHYTAAKFDYTLPRPYGANPSVNDVLAAFAQNREIFGVPYENHDLASYGMFAQRGGYPQENAHVRSESVYPPFVMSGRRQTDTMVRPLYLMLPDDVRRNTAFIMPDRLAQNPQAYLPYLSKKTKVVLIGSFAGSGTITGTSSPDYERMRIRHEREFFKLALTLDLLKAMNIPVSDVLYAMGDSTTTFGLTVRAQNEARFRDLLNSHQVALPDPLLGWGADELAAMAFARQLPSKKVYVAVSNPQARHHYDALQTSDQVLTEKLKTLNLVRVTDPLQADLEVYVTTREPGIETAIAGAVAAGCAATDPGCVGVNGLRFYFEKTKTFGPVTPAQLKFFKPYMTNPAATTTPWIEINYDKIQTAQANHDATLRNIVQALPLERRKRAIIIDARLFNGSWDDGAVPRGNADYLAYSGWGTFGNGFGLAVATGKVLDYTRSYLAKPFDVNKTIKRMYLEAVAHDVYANGYKYGQKLQAGSFAQKVTDAGITFEHHRGYDTEAKTGTVFDILSTHVSQKMQSLYSGTGIVPASGTPFKFTAQFWRTFESEVHLWDSEYDNALFVPGVYRKIDSNFGNFYLNPKYRLASFPNAKAVEVTLDYLVNEF